MSKSPSYEKIEPELQEPEQTVLTPFDQDSDPDALKQSQTEGSRAKGPQNQTIPSEIPRGIPDSPNSNSLTPSTLIASKYEILEKLGSGGMSTVYRVRHVHLNKIFALKLLHEESNLVSIQRFQQEAQAATLLDHPNIVKVHDFGISDGKPYMIMDCISGEPLSERIKTSGQLPPSSITRLFGQIGNALAHAHDQGVVHRDIKPSNIIIKSNEQGLEQAVIVDFGIAKIITGMDDQTSQNLTRTGDIFGTPLYMSPEQCQGHQVDARSDIYSFACVLYESITGAPPFQGESVYQTIHQQITESPPPFAPELRKSKIVRRLEGLVLRAMAKTPDDRYQYMLELTSDLKAIEMGAGGMFSDVSSMMQTSFARLKASERKSVVIKSALRVNTIVALVLATALFVLPTQIQRSRDTMQANRRIVALAQQIFTTDVVDKVANWNQKPELTLIGRLEKLCERSPVHREIRERLVQSLRKALRKTEQLRLNFAARLSSQGLGLADVGSLENSITTTIRCWTDANVIGIELMNYSSNLMHRANEKMEWLQWLQNICWILAAPVVIGFPLLWFLQKKNASAERKATLNPDSR